MILGVGSITFKSPHYIKESTTFNNIIINTHSSLFCTTGVIISLFPHTLPLLLIMGKKEKPSDEEFFTRLVEYTSSTSVSRCKTMEHRIRHAVAWMAAKVRNSLHILVPLPDATSSCRDTATRLRYTPAF